ncbi:MAG: FAD:protein FMN transferase [Deltaproteobacteria bacterium]|nr:FAD:protein FMN transferase [Deltaproteobacteria bacterium]
MGRRAVRRGLLPLLLLGPCVAACERQHPAAPLPAPARSGAAAAVVSAAPGPSAPAATAPGRVELVDRAMGTRVSLAAYASAALSAQQVRAALQAAFAEIQRLERLMTTWRADSEVSAINAAAGKHPVAVGPETFAVIDKSLWTSRLSGGVFDITFAAMSGLWRFDEEHAPALPDPAAVEQARRSIDYRQIALAERDRTVMLRRETIRIDLGGIAKGYAIDRAAEVLRHAGLQSFFAQAGGDLYIAGRKPDGTPWRVGVRDPRGPADAFFATVPVENHAFSTAGDYERSFVLGGKRYHHIIDPRSGYPATQSRSVTIWAPDAFTADAIDDAVFILGPEQGLELVEAAPGCGAVIVDAANKVWISRRLQGLVTVLRPPTDGV